MKRVTKRQVTALKPARIDLFCGFCETRTWWAKRPELVYHGAHRYARWCCESCGRTPERVKAYLEERRVFGLSIPTEKK